MMKTANPAKTSTLLVAVRTTGGTAVLDVMVAPPQESNRL